MITKFKLYEKVDSGEPKIGDYVLCYEERNDYLNGKYLNEFYLKNIGKIVNIDDDRSIPYIIEYENIPIKLDVWFHDLILNCRNMSRSEIIHWSENKEDLEIFIQSNKYNL